MELEEYFGELKRLSLNHTERCGFTVSEDMILEALSLLLSDKLEFDWHGDVLDVDLTADEVRSHLDKFHFEILAGKVLVNYDAIPGDLRLSYKVKVKAAGFVCIIHKNDSDPFPSNPHAHIFELNVKLDLSNGTLYKRRAMVGSLKYKELLSIREAAKKVFKADLPPLQDIGSL